MGYTFALRKLRLSAGYKTAQDFAYELGIANSTYSRYERAPAIPDCGIPLAAAWNMADHLGCTIDEVVGRADVGSLTPTDPKQPLDARAAKLGITGREMLDGYLRYLEFREDELKRDRV